MKKAIGYYRESTLKQGNKGDSIKSQDELCRRAAAKNGSEIVKVFVDYFTGLSSSRPDLDDLFKYLKKNPDIKECYIKDIDRFSREGIEAYFELKEKLRDFGVELLDAIGIIQPAVNTFEDLGFDYSWAIETPSRAAEISEAEQGRKEAKNIVRRTIREQIKLTSKGYQVRAPGYGWINTKVVTEEGKIRTVRSAHPEEFPILMNMYRLRADGLTDKEVVKRINALGYGSKKKHRWAMIEEIDERTGLSMKVRRIVGTIGGTPLSVHQFQKHISRLSNAGVVYEYWNKYVPTFDKSTDRIPVDLFNRANRGKVTIEVNEDGTPSVLFGKERKARNSENPEFPFRRVVLCPHCRSFFKGSSSRGRHGGKFPGYHCNNGHPYYRVPAKVFHAELEKYISNLKLKPQWMELVHQIAIRRWKIEYKNALGRTNDVQENVRSLEQRQLALMQKFETTTSPIMEQKITQQMELLEAQIKEAREVRFDMEVKESQIVEYIREVKKIMEHPGKMLTNVENMREMEHTWYSFFSELPTFEEIKGGTPKKSLVFELAGGSLKPDFELGSALANKVEPQTDWWLRLVSDMKRFFSMPKPSLLPSRSF